jgi:putative phosphoribosyl transferase
MYFQDRFDAGRHLAQRLLKYSQHPETVVLALPRGGVPVAYEVAKALGAPLDVFLVRKLGVPGHEELAMGAVADGGILVLNEDVVESLSIPHDVINEAAQRERQTLQHQREMYRGSDSAPAVEHHSVILVDDGLATGSTMRAAVAALRQQRPQKLIVAVPVGAVETCNELAEEVDEIICAVTPQRFMAVGMWYHDFSPIPNSMVRQLLDEAACRPHRHSGAH